MDATNFNAKLKGLFDSNYIKLSRPMIRIFGLKAALVLCDLCSQYLYWSDNGKIGNGGYFYSTVENIENNTGLTDYEQRQAIKKLTQYGIVKTYLYGMPAKRYFRIEEQGLVKLNIDIAEEQKKDRARIEEHQKLFIQQPQQPEQYPTNISTPKPSKPSKGGVAF